MDNTADRFLSCAQCDFYHKVEYTTLDSDEERTMGPVCWNKKILGMTSLKTFDPPPDFGCNMAIPKDESGFDFGNNTGEPKDGPKPEPANTEFLTCDNCKHFNAVVCCNSSVLGLTPDDVF